MSLKQIPNSSECSKITEIFGTIDVLILDESLKRVIALDYKFGRSRVDHASENIQGHAYMVGTFDKFPWAETVEVHFIAPRLDEVTSHVYHRKDLEWHRLRIKVVIERATEDEPKLNPRTEACRFCKNKVSCPALHEQLLPLAKKYDTNNFAVALLEKYSPDTVDDPNILSRMLEVAPVMEAWAAAAKKRALEVATETGDQIPGYEVRYKSPRAIINDTQKAYETLKDLLSPEEFMEACSVSLVKLAKQYSAHLGRGEKGRARSMLELELMSSGVLPKEEEMEKNPYLKKIN
jgi:hypothetical protein